MSVTLHFGSEKFWLRPPGSEPKGKLVHLVYRSPGTKHATTPQSPKIVPAYKSWNGVWKLWGMNKTNLSTIHNKNMIGWVFRHVALDIGFIEWSFLRFHEANGKIPSKEAPDGYWGGLMIYSWMENDWGLWEKFEHAPVELDELPTHNGVKL